MAYATIDDVTTLVPSLSGTDAEDAAAALLEAASRHVDRYTGRSWLPGAVTGEVQRAYRGTNGQNQIRLDHPPVSAVSSVSARSAYLGATPSVLTSPTGYELVDPTTGLLLVAALVGDLVTVTYTSAPVVPDDIEAATALLAAHWARGAVDNSGAIFSKIRSGTDELVYREQSESLLLPMDVKAILDGYRAAFSFA